MRKPALAVLATIAATAALAGTTRSAAAEDCTHNPASAWNTIAANALYGFRPYLVNLGSAGWQGKERLAAPWVANAAAMKPLCGAPARTAYLLQRRFYSLLRAFPLEPTRAQWKARFRPLIQSAIAADADFLTLMRGPMRKPVNADKAWLVTAQRTPFGSTLS